VAVAVAAERVHVTTDDPSVTDYAGVRKS